MRRPGIRQQQVLEVVYRHGGVYPPSWRIGHDRRILLDNMVAKGMLVRARHSSGQMVYRLPTGGS
jgi:hypothetical protein